jgi:hypothetical protein
MSDKTVRSRIVDLLKTHTIRDCAIIIDGAYYTYASKMVYVKLRFSKDSDVPALIFYTKNNKSAKDAGEEEVYNALDTIHKRLNRTEIDGVAATNADNVNFASMCHIDVCDNARVMIFESRLYRNVKEVVNLGKSKVVSFKFGDVLVSGEILSELCKAFERESFKTYGDLVYSNNSSRFVNKLQKNNRFYNIQRSFIPVFINYDKVYNPIGENNKDVTMSKLYKTAVEKNRFVKVDNISCYFLTHLEICKALGMSNFMRFTPAVLYQVFLGLLYPMYSEFPNKNTKFMVRMEEPIGETKMKNRYTKKNFQEIVSFYKEKLDSTTDPDKREVLEGTIKELMDFQEVDSLYVLCMDNHSRLTHIGASILDNKNDTTVAKLWTYVSEAKLVIQ